MNKSYTRKSKLLSKIFQRIKTQRVDTYPDQFFSENCRGRKIPKLIIQGHHYHDTKTKQSCHTQKRKLQVNITDGHRCKNPQQNSNRIQYHIKKKS